MVSIESERVKARRVIDSSMPLHCNPLAEND